jgi:hypothetical protein
LRNFALGAGGQFNGMGGFEGIALKNWDKEV